MLGGRGGRPFGSGWFAKAKPRGRRFTLFYPGTGQSPSDPVPWRQWFFGVGIYNLGVGDSAGAADATDAAQDHAEPIADVPVDF